jgi:hypothetical protein
VPREKPNIGLYVLALIALARQQQAEAKAVRADTKAQPAGAPETEVRDDQ